MEAHASIRIVFDQVHHSHNIGHGNIDPSFLFDFTDSSLRDGLPKLLTTTRQRPLARAGWVRATDQQYVIAMPDNGADTYSWMLWIFTCHNDLLHP